MNRPRFLADHNFNEILIHGLLTKEPLVDCVFARDVHLDRVRDDDFLAAAASAGRVVLTHDVQTMIGFAKARIVAGQPMTGLAVVLQHGEFGRIIEDLQIAWFASEAGEWRDRIEYFPL